MCWRVVWSCVANSDTVSPFARSNARQTSVFFEVPLAVVDKKSVPGLIVADEDVHIAIAIGIEADDAHACSFEPGEAGLDAAQEQ